MTLALDPAAAIGDDPSVLASIRSGGCALALWRRTLEPALADAVDALRADELDDIDAIVPINDGAIHVAALLGAAGYPVAAAVALARDMAMLAGFHAELWGWASVRIRLDWIETDACRRFHADMVWTRLLTTYAGRGTQWRLADEPDGAAREASAGDVLVLKGRVLAPDAPLLHRSPPIAAEGGCRLLLVVDAPQRETE